MSDLLTLPAGYGFHRLSVEELRERESLFGLLQMFEPPRVHGTRRYVVGADIGDGLGEDRSVAAILRCGSIEEPAEEVAQFVTASLSPSEFAFILDAIGHLYEDQDHVPALMAIECNNHGLSTQDTLQLHLGYSHFYRWEYYDAADPSHRYSTKIGWLTTPRTRPLLLDKFYHAVTSLDALTGLPDLRINSTFTQQELADFQTDGALWEAAAAAGAHDDCLMALAIAHYVAWRLQAGEREPLDERRRRHLEERAFAAAHGTARDFRNAPYTADEAHLASREEPGEDLVDYARY